MFCDEYFQEETKNDIQSMTDQVLTVFENRLSNMEWMSQETRDEAIKKLKAIEVRIGYPDKWP